MNEQHRQAVNFVEKSPSLKSVARELFADLDFRPCPGADCRSTKPSRKSRLLRSGFPELAAK